MPVEDTFNFEQFRRRAQPSTKSPTITIQKRGIFGANYAAFVALGEPEAVHLLFDRERQVIGVRPADPEDIDAIPIRKQPRSFSYLFAGTAFANHYGIPLGQSRRYKAEKVDDMLVVDLNQEPQRTGQERDEFGRIRPAG